MFCVIQEIQNKKENQYGHSKELLVDSFTIGYNNEVNRKYYYKYSDDKFERPVKTTYKISLHHSYRKDGKVKKKQFHICNIDNYSLIEFGWFDCMYDKKIKSIAQQFEISEQDIYQLIEDKITPIYDKCKAKFEHTEEYITHQKHQKIIDTYNKVKYEFSQKYQCNDSEYDYCYNVFGELMNEDYLNKVKADYKIRQEYTKRSYQNSRQSNYNYNSSSSYFNLSVSNYTDDEKVLLKKFYKTLAMKFHPDVCDDDGQAMQLINKLKEEWNM